MSLSEWTPDDVLGRLDGVRRSGNGWVARCPGHDDSHASLSVSTGHDGRPLLFCHAGCDFEDVARKLDGGAVFSRNSTNTLSARPVERKLVCSYPYKDESGTVLFYVDRFEPKDFRPRLPDGSRTLNGARRVLYRLPELLVADPMEPVMLVEGEKDADTLAANGFVATTGLGGAKKWRAEYTEALRGRDVVIVPDNDQPGREHAELVGAEIEGAAASVRVLDLAKHVQMGAKEDVSDFFARGGLPEHLRELIGKAEKLVSSFGPNRQARKRETGGFQLTHVRDLLAEPPAETQWVVDAMLPAGGTSILVARPKVGKTTLARDLAYCVAKGIPFLGRAVKRGTAVLLLMEEKRDELRGQVARLGIDGDDSVFVWTGAAPTNALEALHAVIQEHTPDLVVIDPILKFVRLKDANDYAEVSAALEPVTELARTTGTHLLFIHHQSKGDRSDGESILGSTALFGSVDTSLIMSRRDDVRTLKTIQRYGSDLPETVLDMDEGTGHVALAGEYDELQVEITARGIAKLLDAVGEPMTEAEIREKLGVNRVLVPKALKSPELQKAGLRKEGEGKRGNPYRYSLPRKN
jgi:putative DNA primase/helicase